MKAHRNIYDFIYKNVEEFQNISFTEYFKICVAISIRVLSFYNKEGMTEKTCSQALCPFLDLANYIKLPSPQTKHRFSLKNR